jgi:hypothetical protein
VGPCQVSVSRHGGGLSARAPPFHLILSAHKSTFPSSPSFCCTCSAYIRRLFSVGLTTFPTPPFRFLLFSAISPSLNLDSITYPVDSTLSPSIPLPWLWWTVGTGQTWMDGVPWRRIQARVEVNPGRNLSFAFCFRQYDALVIHPTPCSARTTPSTTLSWIWFPEISFWTSVSIIARLPQSNPVRAVAGSNHWHRLGGQVSLDLEGGERSWNGVKY